MLRRECARDLTVTQLACETPERMLPMSIEKKSLISNRAAIKKAMIANQAVESEMSGDAKSLKSRSLTAHSMKAQRQAVTFKKK